ncbi:MAG: acyl-CoA dehydrogenase family protein [Bacteroidetes bacterium]|nr:acyl-CoA dehydrogenase family protein [Bacteroidota bacterium]
MEKELMTGGAFLLRDTRFEDVFIPEEFNEEQRMIAQTCQDFLETEIFPNLDRIDAQEEGLMRSLLGKAGELGLLGISLPEKYLGFGQSFTTAMLANEKFGAGYSFSVAYSAHIGIGTCPTSYYGSEEQKEKYLPKLATGEWTAAYCLTEPNAGSDANAGKTKAVLSEDGKHYILNGQKMWITNGGFADVLTVFAKIDNDRVLSAFIVDGHSEGITLNPEEKKMGIKGSSTRQIFFNDVKVPVENLIGCRGGGFRIALDILHMGRIKLGGIVIGAEKISITQSVNYANERKQFGSFLSEFAAIKSKIAEQVIRTFTNESAVYRICQHIDELKDSYIEKGMDHGKAEIKAISQYAIEAAMMKVYGSEVLDFVVDEAVQIHGGMGFSSESKVERGYRDSRINRIFEGTNEINRLLTIDSTLKKAMKKEIEIFEMADVILDEIHNIDEHPPIPEDYYEAKHFYIRGFKKAILMIIGQAYRNLKNQLVQEQEIMMNLADMMMQLYAAESTALRVEKLEKIHNSPNTPIYRDILDVFIYDAGCRIRKSGMDAIASFVDGDQFEKMYTGLHTYTRVIPVNVKESRRRIAEKIIEDNRYSL